MSPMHALQQLPNDDPQSHPLQPPSRHSPKRLTNWDDRLRDKLKEWSPRGFQWGSADCVHFVFDCVESMTGKAHLAGIEAYRCEREALKVLASINRRGLLHAVETFLGPAEDIEPNMAPLERGDVVMTLRKVVGAPRRRGPGLGICSGSDALFVGARGLEEVSLADCLYGWRV